MALIDNENLYENIEKKLELIKAAKEQPVIMKPFIKDFAYRFCWSSNALEGNTLSLDETICLIDYDVILINLLLSERGAIGSMVSNMMAYVVIRELLGFRFLTMKEK